MCDEQGREAKYYLTAVHWGNILHPMIANADPLLARIGERVRSRRRELGLTARTLAERAGLSPRFISLLESGTGNIAIGRLARVAEVLELPLSALVESPADPDGPRPAIDRLLSGRSGDELARCLRFVELALGEDRRSAVSLLGLRGAGKSTVGPLVAAGLGLPFVILDERIQSQAGLDLAEIFAIHGEAYYRRLQARCLSELLAEGRRCVVELPGGIVRNDEAFELALRYTTTVWLQAQPEEHMSRVLDQGDTRPVADRRNAMEELRSILDARVPLYRRAAITVETSGRSESDAAGAMVDALAEHGWSPAEG